MSASKDFARKVGFTTPLTEKLIDLAEKEGAIGAAQNMIGEAVHALTTNENVEKIYEIFAKYLHKEKIIVSLV